MYLNFLTSRPPQRNRRFARTLGYITLHNCCFGAHAPNLENRTTVCAVPMFVKGTILPTQRVCSIRFALPSLDCVLFRRPLRSLRFPFIGSSKVDWQRKVGKRHNYSFDGLTADFSSPGGVGEGGRGENEPILIPLSLFLSFPFQESFVIACLATNSFSAS